MPGTGTTKGPTARTEGITPIPEVRNLRASMEGYGGVLGFKVHWHVPGIMALVSRDRSGIMLCEGGPGNPCKWLCIGVTDADALFVEYTASGATIGLPPTN